VLILSQYVEPHSAMQLLEEHPKRVGYLLKERIFDVVTLIDALQRLADGETIIDPTIVSRLLVTPHRPSQGPDRARARSARARRRGTLKQNKRGARSSSRSARSRRTSNRSSTS